SQNQFLHFLPNFRSVFHFRVSFAKNLLVPWDRRDIDSFFTVVELEIAKDGRPQRIFSDDGSLSSDTNTVSLKYTGSTGHVGRDASISSPYAVNLDRQKDWHTQLVQLPRQLHNGGTTKALAVKNQTGRSTFFWLQLAITISIEGFLDQLDGQAALPVFHGFNMK